MNKRLAKIEAYSLIQCEIEALLTSGGLCAQPYASEKDILKVGRALEKVQDEFSRRESRLCLRGK